MKKKKIIDDDDDTIMDISSHFTATYEQYNDRYLIYRHRDRHCINYVLVFAFFTIIVLIEEL